VAVAYGYINRGHLVILKSILKLKMFLMKVFLASHPKTDCCGFKHFANNNIHILLFGSWNIIFFVTFYVFKSSNRTLSLKLSVDYMLFTVCQLII